MGHARNNMKKKKVFSSPTAVSVYVIGLEGMDGYSKIGISNNVPKRVSAISTSTPFKPYAAYSFLLRTETGARTVEQKAHGVLAKFRVNGEWFRVPPLLAWQAVKPIAEDWQIRNPPKTIGEAIAFSDIRETKKLFQGYKAPQTQTQA